MGVGVLVTIRTPYAVLSLLLALTLWRRGPNVLQQGQQFLVGHGSVFLTPVSRSRSAPRILPVPVLGPFHPRSAEKRLASQRLALGTEPFSVVEPVVGGCAAGVEHDRPAADAAELVERGPGVSRYRGCWSRPASRRAPERM